jgi:16S rRNA (cytidine1402-2'-O)-methyltransferase
MKEHFSDRRFLLALNLSQTDETILEGKIDFLLSSLSFEKAEFMLLVYPA